jgi:uncharacterized membrane protein
MAEAKKAPVGGVTQDDKLWACLSWLFFPVAIIALLMEDKKARPFVKYHAVVSLAFAVVWAVVGTITVGCGGVVGLIYAIYAAVKAYQGEMLEVPVLSDFVRNQGWV